MLDISLRSRTDEILHGDRHRHYCARVIPHVIADDDRTVPKMSIEPDPTR